MIIVVIVIVNRRYPPPSRIQTRNAMKQKPSSNRFASHIALSRPTSRLRMDSSEQKVTENGSEHYHRYSLLSRFWLHMESAKEFV
jgi:hypothetical protein